MADYRWMAAVGAILEHHRSSSGIKAAEMSRRIGVNRSYISLIEKGTKTASGRIIAGYERELGLENGAVITEAEAICGRKALKSSPQLGPAEIDGASISIAAELDPCEVDRKLLVRLRIDVISLGRCEGIRFGVLGAGASALAIESIEPARYVEVHRQYGPLPYIEIMIADLFNNSGERMTWFLEFSAPYNRFLLMTPVLGTYITCLSLSFDTYGVDPDGLFVANFLNVDIEDIGKTIGAPNFRARRVTPLLGPLVATHLEIGRAYGVQWVDKIN